MAVLLAALSSCEKNCYQFTCKDEVTSSNGFNTTTTVTKIEKCNLTSKDAKNFVNTMNGTGSVTTSGKTTTFSTNCTSSLK